MGYKMGINIGSYIANAMLALPDAIRGEFRQRLQTDLKPIVEKSVNKWLAPYPPVRNGSIKFKFATDKSRMAFFASGGFGKGIPTKRDGTLGKGWEVQISYKIGSNALVRVYNKDKSARYVYGPRQVLGHADSGWGVHFDTSAGNVQDDTEEAIVDLWDQSISTVAKK